VTIRSTAKSRAAASILLLSTLLAASALVLRGSPAEAAKTKTKPRPNVVVIQTDDQTLNELYATYTPPGGATVTAMPNTLGLIAGRGETFSRYYVSYSLCCPSRVTLLTGRYAHNHNVRGNIQPNGGYSGFAARTAFNHNLAVWMQRAGYRTVHIGKFLNGYGDLPYSDGLNIPPGWSAWHTVLQADSQHLFYGYTLNDNGQIDGPLGDPGDPTTRDYGVRDDPGCPLAPANGLPCFYETDVFNGIASQEITNTPADRPLYMQLDYTAPHGDFRRPAGPEPAPRHYDSFVGVPRPHNEAQGFNEADASDKPQFIRDAPPLTPTEQHTYRVYYEKALESLRSIDDGVAQIVGTLGAAGRLRNTYIIFTSDNGFFFGEHRLAGGKFLAYEPSTHLPFLIRGPGIKPGSSSGELAANVDIAPTILELARAKADKSVDGRSLVPFLTQPGLRTRRPILFESFVESSDVEANGTARHRSTAQASITSPPKDYEGIRLGPWKYIEWPTGEKELYDVATDPYELHNRVQEPNLFPIREFLHRRLRRLEGCVGRQCREVTPPIPLTRKQQRRENKKKHHNHHAGGHQG
jgi:N-acetylglucosamine-6-sulfatase